MKIDSSLFLSVVAGAQLAQAFGQGHEFLHKRAATTTSASALSSPDKPTLIGTVGNCNQWYDVVSGDSCWSIAKNFGVTQDQFAAWNPAVGTKCVVELGVSYCVGVGPVVSTSPASSKSSTGSAASTTLMSTGSVTSNSTSATPYSTLSYNTTTNPVTITDSNWPPAQTQSGQPSYCGSSHTYYLHPTDLGL